MRKFLSAVLFLTLSAGITAVRAGDTPPALESTLRALGIVAESVAETPMPGLYEVTVGTRVLYLSSDGKLFVRGEIIDVQSNRNLTNERVGTLRRDLLSTLDESKMIVFAPAQVKHTVTVFTDVDCGYCAKLHREMKQYHARGIEVRYLAYPRAGVDSASGRKIASVWCAADQHQAMTDAKSGRSVSASKCDSPVADHFALGRQFGVRGTPTMVLDTGQLVPGYAPANDLLKMLEDGKAG